MTQIAVISPATDTLLTTLANAKRDMLVSGSADDVWLTARIDQMSDAIANYCNRIFGRQQVKQIFRVRQGVDLTWPTHNLPISLVLSLAPIVSIDSVAENGAVLDPSLYEVETGGALYRLNNDYRMPWYGPKIEVTYTTGWILPSSTNPPPTLPSDIEMACIEAVRAAYLRRDRDPSVVREDIDGVYRTGYDPAGTRTILPDGVLAILQSWQSHLVG